MQINRIYLRIELLIYSLVDMLMHFYIHYFLIFQNCSSDLPLLFFSQQFQSFFILHFLKIMF
ncbi:hypothetical protein WUBG_01854 [Wuchereria bancrofti]|uniref:Uncharacterized protein n=1 Tax=Wuchereria bancrofti TaxID=6293 RepID=J9BIL3_WUCBA|nr:hypothetical protein WUBG_01854 [Wuchereria bancrofti]